MTIPQGKRRRTDGGASSDAGAEGTAAASHAALSAAVRASLSEAAAAAASAASARTEAAEVTVRSMAEVSAAAARSMAACQVAEGAAAKAVASASALARELGIEVGDGDDVAARSVEGFETAQASKGARKGARGDGNGDSGVATQMSEAASASKVGRGDGGGNGGVTVFHLPDAIIEKIFDLLGGVRREEDEKAEFPCWPDLAKFALSCRRFARLFRGSYVTNITFDAVFRFTKGARDYHEVVSGALSRFTNVSSVTVINFDCFPVPGISECRALVWAEEESNYVLDESRELDFRIAAADQSSIPEAVARRIGDCTGGATVKRLCFEEHDGLPHSILAPGSVSWKGECARWLDYLPNATDVCCKEFQAFCNSSRSCGANGSSLKALGIEWDTDCDSDGPWDAYLLSFLQFRNLETLVLSVENFGGNPTELELLMLPKVLELLPNLGDFGILLSNNINQLPVEGSMSPLLQSLFRNPSVPVEGRCKLRVHVGIFDFYDFNDVEGTLKALRACIAGDSLPEWEVTEEPNSGTLFQSVMGPPLYLDVVALAIFCSTPSSM